MIDRPRSKWMNWNNALFFIHLMLTRWLDFGSRLLNPFWWKSKWIIAVVMTRALLFFGNVLLASVLLLLFSLVNGRWRFLADWIVYECECVYVCVRERSNGSGECHPKFEMKPIGNYQTLGLSSSDRSRRLDSQSMPSSISDHNAMQCNQIHREDP